MYLLFNWKFYPFVLANVHMALSKSLYLTAFLFSLLNVLVLFFKPMLQIPVFQCDFFGIQRNQIIFKMHVYGCLPINTSKLPKNIDLNTMELNRSRVSEKVYRRRFWNICRCLPFVSNRQRPQKELSGLGSCLSSCQFVFARRTNMLLENGVSPHWGSCYWHCF